MLSKRSLFSLNTVRKFLLFRIQMSHSFVFQQLQTHQMAEIGVFSSCEIVEINVVFAESSS